MSDRLNDIISSAKQSTETERREREERAAALASRKAILEDAIALFLRLMHAAGDPGIRTITDTTFVKRRHFFGPSPTCELIDVKSWRGWVVDHSVDTGPGGAHAIWSALTSSGEWLSGSGEPISPKGVEHVRGSVKPMRSGEPSPWSSAAEALIKILIEFGIDPAVDS